MNQTTQLFEKLGWCAEDAPEWRERYDDFTTRLNILSKHLGQYRDIGDLYKNGPWVISFNQGSLCPYCLHELDRWRDNLAALHGSDGNTVAMPLKKGEGEQVPPGITRIVATGS
jgi:hypothetical protein